MAASFDCARRKAVVLRSGCSYRSTTGDRIAREEGTMTGDGNTIVAESITAEQIINQGEAVFKRPDALSDTHTHYCPGCTHGIIHRLIAEAIDELCIGPKTIMVAPVGCSVLMYYYYNIDGVEAAHGRAPAMATGLKRTQPDKVVFTYQGDGDLASIGAAEILHAANRGENITVFFVNNAVYGMTSGQLAPTSLIGQVTTSSRQGRDVKQHGYPMRMAEIIAGLPGASYVVRRTVYDPKTIRQAKKAVLTAFKAQLAGLGLSLVEFLSSCPTNWHMSPPDALTWIRDTMVPYFPLGDFKVTDAVKALE
jgi:2-oxoglutarate ferredoxin oxidoreductase subunit beta